jgi:hypothetical protein
MKSNHIPRPCAHLLTLLSSRFDFGDFVSRLEWRPRTTGGWPPRRVRALGRPDAKVAQELPEKQRSWVRRYKCGSQFGGEATILPTSRVARLGDLFFGKVFLKRGCPGWGANPGPLNSIYFHIFTTLPLSHSGPPREGCLKITKVAKTIGLRFSMVEDAHWFWQKNGLGYILGFFFTNPPVHPAR